MHTQVWLTPCVYRSNLKVCYSLKQLLRSQPTSLGPSNGPALQPGRKQASIARGPHNHKARSPGAETSRLGRSNRPSRLLDGAGLGGAGPGGLGFLHAQSP
jgi:hypothetical protein